MQETDELAITIVKRVAEREGADPIDLDPLYESVDMDALESLVDSSSTDKMQVSVSFTYYDYTVCVDAESGVHVSKSSADAIAATVDA